MSAASLALTIGEPAGIGPDIALAAWRRRRELALPAFYLLADPDFVARARAPGRARRADPGGGAGDGRSNLCGALPVVDLGVGDHGRARPARRHRAPPAAIAAIRRAVADVLAGRAAAVVTNPVAKSVLYRSGFAEPGHTEFLAKLVAERTGRSARPVMMLWSPELAVVPVTIHLPLSRGAGAAHDRDRSSRPGASWRGISASGSASPARGSRSPGSTRTPARRARSGRRTAAVVAPAVAQLRAARHRRAGTAPRRYHVPCGGARDLRRALCMYHDQALDPDQDAGVRPCGQCHARPADRAHVARPRHGLRHRRHRQGRSGEPDRSAAPRRPAHRRTAALPRVAARAMTPIDDLPPLREVIRRHGLARASRSVRISSSTSI